MREYRNSRMFTEDYLYTHPDEVDTFVTELFEEYREDNNLILLLTGLRIVARIKGVSDIADASGLSRKGVQKALSEEGNPSFENVNAILHAMGYKIIVEKE